MQANIFPMLPCETSQLNSPQVWGSRHGLGIRTCGLSFWEGLMVLLLRQGLVGLKKGTIFEELRWLDLIMSNMGCVSLRNVLVKLWTELWWQIWYLAKLNQSLKYWFEKLTVFIFDAKLIILSLGEKLTVNKDSRGLGGRSSAVDRGAGNLENKYSENILWTFVL